MSKFVNGSVANMKNLIFYILLMLLIPTASIAQDPMFSQFYAAPLQLNPALSGMAFSPRINLNYRNQWPSIDNGFVTYAASYDQHIESINSGIGISFYTDRVAGGLLNTYSLSLTYAYQIQFSRKFGIKIGAEAGFTHRKIDWARLTFTDMINPVFGFVNEFNVPNPTLEIPPDDFTHIYPDFGIGAVAFSKDFYGGFAIKHITRPKDNFRGTDDRIPLRITLHGGGQIDLAPKNRKKDIYLSPNVLLAQQSNSFQLNVGTYLLYEYFYFGGWYRNNISNSDAVIGLVGVKTQYFKIGYSYDVTLSDLAVSSGGAHEISTTFYIGGEDNSISPRNRAGKMDCPGILGF